MSEQNGYDDERRVAGRDMAPGAPRAVAMGCSCSVLANAAYRAQADAEPFLDPSCPVHPGDVPSPS